MRMHIEMKNISKAFSGNPVLKNAQFMIETGEVHALMGKTEREIDAHEDSNRCI